MPNRLGLPPIPSYLGSNVVLVLLAVAVIGWYGYRAVMSYIPPSKYLSAQAEPPVVVEGSSLLVTLLIDRNRHCPTTLYRYILTNTKPPKLIWSGTAIGGITDLGQHYATHEIDAAKFLKPGEYIFRGAAYPRCSEGEFYYFHKDIEFKVLPRTP